MNDISKGVESDSSPPKKFAKKLNGEDYVCHIELNVYKGYINLRNLFLSNNRIKALCPPPQKKSLLSLTVLLFRLFHTGSIHAVSFDSEVMPFAAGQ
jgi:hypothetical protein